MTPFDEFITRITLFYEKKYNSEQTAVAFCIDSYHLYCDILEKIEVIDEVEQFKQQVSSLMTTLHHDGEAYNTLLDQKITEFCQGQVGKLSSLGFQASADYVLREKRLLVLSLSHLTVIPNLHLSFKFMGTWIESIMADLLDYCKNQPFSQDKHTELSDFVNALWKCYQVNCLEKNYILNQDYLHKFKIYAQNQEMVNKDVRLEAQEDEVLKLCNARLLSSLDNLLRSSTQALYRLQSAILPSRPENSMPLVSYSSPRRYEQSTSPRTTEELFAELRSINTGSQFFLHDSERIDKLQHEYIQVQREIETLRSGIGKDGLTNESELIALIKSLGEEIGVTGGIMVVKEEVKHRYLALIIVFFEHNFKIQLHDTQVLALLTMLSYPENVRGIIAGVRTGEGKSHIIAVLTLIMANIGKQVYVVTSSNYLALEAKNRYTPLFERLGYKTADLCEDYNAPSASLCNVIYSKNSELQFRYLSSRVYREYELSLPDAVLIVDEIDHTLLDDKGGAYMARSKSYLSIPQFYQHLLNFGKTYLTKDSQDFNAAWIARIKNYFKRQLELLDQQDHLKKLEDIPQNQWGLYLESLVKALFYLKKDIDFVIEEDKLIIVDTSTGELKTKRLRWKNGLHELLETQYGLSRGTENDMLAYSYTPTFFDLFPQLFGLTGTLGKRIEQQEIKQHHGLVTARIMPHRRRQREKKPSLLFSSKLEYYDAMISILEDYRKKRPVLIVFNSILEAESFAECLIDNQVSEFQLLTGSQKKSQKEILDKAGHPGQVTVATKLASRGVDILVTKEAQSEGGLHVILGFYPASSRVKQQVLGRTARQGQPGSTQLVVFHPNPKMTFEKLKKHRNQRMEDKYKIGFFDHNRQKVLGDVMHRLYTKLENDDAIFAKEALKSQFYSKVNSILQSPDFVVPEEKEWKSFYSTLRLVYEGKMDGLESLYSIFKANYFKILQDRWTKFYTNLHRLEYDQLIDAGTALNDVEALSSLGVDDIGLNEDHEQAVPTQGSIASGSTAKPNPQDSIQQHLLPKQEILDDLRDVFDAEKILSYYQEFSNHWKC